MSLILEALRKSEAERRRAQAAETLAEPVAAPRRGASQLPRWFWPLVAASGLLLVAWLTRGSWLPSAETRPVVEGIAIADTAQAGPRNVPAPEPVDSVPVTPASSSPSVTAADAVITNATTVNAQAATFAKIAPNPPVASRAAPASAPPAESIPTVADQAPPLPTSLHPGAPPTTPPPAPTQAASATVNPTLRLSDLGNEERQQLPALKMSMHMWAPEPSQRFAIIDGNRVGEGDRVGNAVVDSIDAEGVVLAWNGHRLRVSVR